MFKIAFDGLGGEKVERQCIKAIEIFLHEVKNASVCIATSKDSYTNLLNDLDVSVRDRALWLDGSERIEFTESPVAALKKKTKASVAVAIQAVRRGECQAMLSFGHTGAAVASAQLSLGLIYGVSKAGLATILPNEKGSTLLMDIGANLNCKPDHLFQYGLMADVYAKTSLKIKSPRIGLLNVGEEREKGDTFLQETHRRFEEGSFNFVGNVEGGQVFDGTVDVVICNGITGNMLLKSSESLAKMLISKFSKEMSSYANKGLNDSGLFKKIMAKFALTYDPDSRGASRLLGVNGLVLIGHGNAGEAAILNGLKSAYNEVSMGLQPAICERLESLGEIKK